MTRQILERRRTIPDLRNSPPPPQAPLYGFEKGDFTNATTGQQGREPNKLSSDKMSVTPQPFRLLHSLPIELLQLILPQLPRPTLCAFSLTSQWCYSHAVQLLWREVELVDCTSIHVDPVTGAEIQDDHDDTPLIKKLFLLATRPHLAACVEVVTHRCHLPPPAIFHELPRCAFSGMTLSCDARTVALAKMAVRRMKHVREVRVVLGHLALVDVLLRGFFDERRVRGEGVRRVRKLWLENCRVSSALAVELRCLDPGEDVVLSEWVEGQNESRGHGGSADWKLGQDGWRPPPSARELWMRWCSKNPRWSADSVRPQYGKPRLWRNNPHGLAQKLCFDGLESVRFRRLHLVVVPCNPHDLDSSLANARNMVYTRGPRREPLQDGVGGRYEASTNTFVDEMQAGQHFAQWFETRESLLVSEEAESHLAGDLPGSRHPLVKLFEHAHTFDELEYAALESQIDLPEDIHILGTLTRRQRAEMAYRGTHVDLCRSTAFEQITRYPLLDMQRDTMPSATAALSMLQSASSTLTSINLDWIMTMPYGHLKPPRRTLHYERWVALFRDLFMLRFPNLRCFQLRNCVASQTQLPDDLYLLDSSSSLEKLPWAGEEPDAVDQDMYTLAPLAFLEAHPNLRSLAWPMSHFFSRRKSTDAISERVQKVIEKLAQELIDLRVDTKFSEYGEAFSEQGSLKNVDDRLRRRRFITDFCPKMEELQTIKIEGGMPRDERREIVRALHACPLQKIVTIGICSPIGNTWGGNGADVIGLVDDHDRSHLESEDKSAVCDLGPSKLLPPSDHDNFTFEPLYGWEGQPPMLHTLASYHSSSVRELKFCGWKGSPVLLSPTAITNPLLAPLKHFHHLESLIMSLWLSTLFEGDTRDHEVISYWTSARSPDSKALVVICDEEPDCGWHKELRTKFAPDALAWRVTNFLGPYLSEIAKARKGGVHVRASFSLGDWGGIFDLDLRIGKGAMGSDVCLEFEGPREELEPKRRREKLEGRRWF